MSERAQSVPRETRSGPDGWAWWREHNPLDGEVAAQPWSNLGLVDLDATDRRRVGHVLGRHYCSSCQVSWCDPGHATSRCWACGEVADEAWPGTSPGHDGMLRNRPATGVSGT